MKNLQDMLNEAKYRNPVPTKQSYIDYILENYGGYIAFDTAKDGYLQFEFQDYYSEQKFCKVFMPLWYDMAFKYSKKKHEDGQYTYIVTVDLKKLAEIIANMEMPRIIDRMAELLQVQPNN